MNCTKLLYLAYSKKFQVFSNSYLIITSFSYLPGFNRAAYNFIVSANARVHFPHMGTSFWSFFYLLAAEHCLQYLTQQYYQASEGGQILEVVYNE